MALRDRAIIGLAVNAPCLRRSEIMLLDVGHIDVRRDRVTVLGKGRLVPEKLPLSHVGVEAPRRWLEVRGGHRPAVLFIRPDRGARGEALRRTLTTESTA
jgi:site-specific recombinase XerC